MRNVTTYRICAGAAIALLLLGVLRDEIWTVVAGGGGALYCLRWARIERQAEEIRRSVHGLAADLAAWWAVSEREALDALRRIIGDDPVRPRK